jgi:hypothetical protein
MGGEGGEVMFRVLLGTCLVAGLMMLTGNPGDPPEMDRSDELVVIAAYVVTDLDEDGNLTGVLLEENAGEQYHVVLDRKGRELGESFGGEWVEVEGRVMDKEGELWLTVQNVSRYLTEEDEEVEYYEESATWDDPDAPDDDQAWQDTDEDVDEDVEADDWDEDELEETWDDDEPVADDNPGLF